MVYFRDANGEVWYFNKFNNKIVRKADFDDTVDYVHSDGQYFKLLRDGSFCDISNVVKMGKTINCVFCLDDEGVIYIIITRLENTIHLIDVENFWNNGNNIIVKHKDGICKLFNSSFGEINYNFNLPDKDFIGFRYFDSELIFILRKFEQHIPIYKTGCKISDIGINSEGVLAGNNFTTKPFTCPVKFIREMWGEIIVFLEDGSVHIMINDHNGTFIKMITNSGFPLDYNFKANVKSAQLANCTRVISETIGESSTHG